MTSLVLSQVAAVRELAGMSCIVPVPALLSLLSVDKLESLVCVDMSSTHEDMIKIDSEFNQSDCSSHMTSLHAAAVAEVTGPDQLLH